MFAMLVASLVACTSGGYQVFQIAGEIPQLSPECYSNGALPPDVAADTDTFHVAVRVAVFTAADDAVYFETADSAIAGTRDGKSYTFSGAYTDVTAAGQITTTTVDKQDVSLDVSGSHVTGTYTETATFTCDGSDRNCSADSSCSVTIGFEGVRVSDDLGTLGTLGDTYLYGYGGYTGGYDTGGYY